MSSYIKRPPSKLFIPARDSRHRTACLALYRALLRSTPKIALPRSDLDAWQPVGDPLRHCIRRAFRRNRTDTSPRLIFPALDAGYRALATIHNAVLAPSTVSPSSPSSSSSSDPTSPNPNPNPNPTPNLNPNPAAPPDETKDEVYKREQARDVILRFLAARQLERRRSLTAKETHPPHSRNPPPPSSAPREETLPLLVRVTSPADSSPSALPYAARLRQQQQDEYQRRYQSPLLGEEYQQPQQEEPPVYMTPHRPVPASELGGSGRRRVPHLEMAGDFVFLRKSKPQSPVLSRVLLQKIRTREKRASLVQALMDEMIPDAELEDAWEESVEDMLLQQGQDERNGAGGGDTWTVHWNDDGGGRGYDSYNGSNGSGKGDRRRKMSGYRRAAQRNDEDTYRHSLWWHGVVYIQDVLSREREDQVARAAALRDLIIQERELAAKEKHERWEARRRYWEENIKPTMEGNEDGSRPEGGVKAPDGNGDWSRLGEGMKTGDGHQDRSTKGGGPSF
ncbi:hypothetical protein SLS62_003564 [Diatrype stigma]|uniref:Complex 1 LYR protein domain-containing protein n=1 Tax=Diatrype stigma TaxID=117547 RepID=A0AAN9UUV4_9PEZI